MGGIAWWSSAQGVMGGGRGWDTLTVSQFHMVAASGDRKLNFLLSINLKYLQEDAVVRVWVDSLDMGIE